MPDNSIQPAGAESVVGLFDAEPCVHYAPTGRLTACGLSTDYAVHTAERDVVSGCSECLAAAAAVPPQCTSCHYDYCFCFEAGFAAGLAAALASDRRQE